MKAVRIFSAVVAMALMAGVAFAQETPPAGPPAGGAGGGRGGRGGAMFNPVEMLKNRIKQLNLSADDQAKVDAVFKDLEPKVTEAQKAYTAAQTELREKVMEQLTPEMKEKLQNMRGGFGGGGRGGRGNRGGGGNGGGNATPPAKPEA